MGKQIKNIVPSLTAILVKDHNSGGFTAFFAQFPNIIVEGDTEKQAIKNLFVLSNDVFNQQVEENMESVREYDDNSIITRSYPLLVPA